MTMSSTIQEVVLEFLSDKQEHSVQDIKHYLREQDVRDYTEGQFAGSLNTLMRNGSITKVDRGIYSIKLRSEDMKKCFVVSPMVDDYGLSYYAAFVGCSAETEASFETITFLAGKTDELGLKNIMTIEKSDQKIAKTIIENTKEKNQGILTLDSMQSTTSDDVKKGATYFSIMENNLNVLQEALQ